MVSNHKLRHIFNGAVDHVTQNRVIPLQVFKEEFHCTNPFLYKLIKEGVLKPRRFPGSMRVSFSL